MIDLDGIDIYDNQSFADLLERIDKKNESRSRKIGELIDDLSDLVEELDDAMMIAPLIADYLKLDVKNDDGLIKVASMVQRIVTSTLRNSDGDSSDISDTISDQEKKQLQEMAKGIRQSRQDAVDSKVTDKDFEEDTDYMNDIDEELDKLQDETSEVIIDKSSE